MDDRNKRILAQRTSAVTSFVQLTGADDGQAWAWMTQCAFDVDAAVGAYFDAGGKKIPPMAAPAPAPASAPTSTGAGSSSRDAPEAVAEEKQDDISKLMSDAKQMTPEEMREAKSFAGQGRSVGSTGNDKVPEKKVRLTFYEDGFTAVMESEPISTTHASRRTGMHTYESSKENDLKELPPLRDYESNKKIIDDVKAHRQYSLVLATLFLILTTTFFMPVPHRVPQEFRGQWRVQIMLDDKRPTKYPPQAKGQRLSAFSGAGNSLGGSPARSTNAVAVQAPGNTPGGVMFPTFWPAALLYDIGVWSVLVVCRCIHRH
jgi:hypothetical protein